jgi:hypothetical protein
MPFTASGWEGLWRIGADHSMNLETSRSVTRSSRLQFARTISPDADDEAVAGVTDSVGKSARMRSSTKAHRAEQGFGGRVRFRVDRVFLDQNNTGQLTRVSHVIFDRR